MMIYELKNPYEIYDSQGPLSCNSSPAKKAQQRGLFAILGNLNIRLPWAFPKYSVCFFWISHNFLSKANARVSVFLMRSGLVLNFKKVLCAMVFGHDFLASDKLISWVSTGTSCSGTHRSCDGWSWKSGKDLTWKIRQLTEKLFRKSAKTSPARKWYQIFQHQPFIHQHFRKSSAWGSPLQSFPAGKAILELEKASHWGEGLCRWWIFNASKREWGQNFAGFFQMYTLQETNMDTQNDGLEKVTPNFWYRC